MTEKKLAEELQDLFESSEADRRAARDQFSKTTIAKYKPMLQEAAVKGKNSIRLEFSISDLEVQVLEGQGLIVKADSWGDAREGGNFTTITFPHRMKAR